MNKIYKIKARVWKWPGDGGWHFVNLDRDLAGEIKKNSAQYRYGAGFVRAVFNIGETKWESALFPYTKDKTYLISIKKDVRKKEGIREGDMVEIVFKLLK